MRMHRYFVYLITNRTNGKIYVGKTCDVKGRWATHRSRAKAGEKSALYAAIRKYGEQAFAVETIISCWSEVASFDLERDTIVAFRAKVRGVGYNLTDGGEGASGHTLSDAHRAKIAERTKARGARTESEKQKIRATLAGHVVSTDTRQRIREALATKRADGWIAAPPPPARFGADNHFYGRTHSAGARAKMRAAKLGRTLSPEHKAKIGSAGRGKNHGPQSDAHREKNRAGHLGLKHTDEAKRKMSQAHKGKKMGEDFRQKIRDSWVARRAAARLEV